MPFLAIHEDLVKLDDPVLEEERRIRTDKQLMESFPPDFDFSADNGGGYVLPNGLTVMPGDAGYNPNSMFTLGIDQSISSTGFVVLRPTDKDPLDHGLIKSTKEDFSEFARPIQQVMRMRKIAKELVAHLKAQSYWQYIWTVGIEGLAFSKSGDATRDLAGLQAIIISELISEGFNQHNIRIIDPGTVKKTAGHGHFKKEQMFDALPPVVNEKFSQYLKSKGRYDVTDAYWIAVTERDTPRPLEIYNDLKS